MRGDEDARTSVLDLYRYQVVKTSEGRLFALGYDQATAHIRFVELAEFDSATRSGVSISGTLVSLVGHFALDMDIGALWATYRAEHGLGEYKDVTPMPTQD